MRVLSVSTGTHFVTGLVSLNFCEGYMKHKILFFKKFEKKLERNFKPSVKNLHGPKSSFFLCDEYMDVKIMSRVLVGFDKTTDFRGYTRMDGDGHGFFERLPHKSLFGAIILLILRISQNTFL